MERAPHTPARDRFLALDGLRGWAAIGVITVHVAMFTGNDPGRPTNLLQGFVHELRLGLPFFFALSGYLLYRPWIAGAFNGRRPRIRSYAWRRAGRIMPLYYATLFGGLLLLIGTDSPYLPEGQWWLTHLFFLQSYFAEAAGTINPPMWTLVIEVAFYMLLPLVGLLALRLGATRRRQLLLPAALVVVGLVWTTLNWKLDWSNQALRAMPTMLPIFACGMAAAALEGRPGRLHLSPGAARGLFSLGFALVLFHAWYRWQTPPDAYRAVLRDFPAGIGFGCVILGTVARPPLSMEWPVSRALGHLSYGLYLWHFPIMLFLINHGLWPSGMAAAFALLTVLSLAFAAVTWKWLEQSALRWARDRARRSATAPAEDDRQSARAPADSPVPAPPPARNKPLWAPSGQPLRQPTRDAA